MLDKKTVQLARMSNPRDVADILEIRVSGYRPMIRCLWHEDRNPSCALYEDHMYCFSCGRSFNSIDMVMTVLECSFIRAVEFIVANVGLQEPEIRSIGQILDDKFIEEMDRRAKERINMNQYEQI